MPVKIRLARRGRKQRPYYHVIIADARAPRDGKFIEQIGSYNPMTKPATIELDRDAAYAWLMKGAQPTDTVRAILRFKGVMYRKHLQRGVSKGAMTQDAADKLYEDYIATKDAKTAERFAVTAKELLDRHAAISGVAKAPPAKVAEDTGSEFRETADADSGSEFQEGANEAEAVVEEAVAEAPAADAVAEAPAEEAAPAAEETKDEA